MDLRPVLYVIGILLCILAVGMAPPMLVDIHYGHTDWKNFFLCIMITSFFGGALVLTTSGAGKFEADLHQTFFLTFLSWIGVAVFAALPFRISALGLDTPDAFFEAVSGITGTGLTAIAAPENAPPGLLLWRAILQWAGGYGFIIMALAALPYLKIGGMQIFRVESIEHERAMPRTTSLAFSILYVYIGLTIACLAAYRICGMNMLESLIHAMTTISTGGFSTHSESLGYFGSTGAEATAMIFMVLGSLPFILYLRLLGGAPDTFLRDRQVRWFAGIILCVTVALAVYFVIYDGLSWPRAIWNGLFNTISTMTGTGYSLDPGAAWGSFAAVLFFFLVAAGGCAGSTAGGIKIFRFKILWSIMMIQFKKVLFSHGVFQARYGGKALPDAVPSSVMGFFFVYALSFAALACALSAAGLALPHALSAAAASISNAGVDISATGHFTDTEAGVSDAARWLMSAGMIIGRMEIFTFLVMLSPGFWRR